MRSSGGHPTRFHADGRDLPRRRSLVFVRENVAKAEKTRQQQARMKQRVHLSRRGEVGARRLSLGMYNRYLPGTQQQMDQQQRQFQSPTHPASFQNEERHYQWPGKSPHGEADVDRSFDFQLEYPFGLTQAEAVSLNASTWQGRRIFCPTTLLDGSTNFF